MTSHAYLADRPRRIQRTHTLGWRVPAGAVYVGRPSKFGNPIGVVVVAAQFPSLDKTSVARLVVRDFEVLALRGSLTLSNWRFLGGRRGPVTWTYPSLGEIRAELAGKDLACWCPLVDARGNPMPCHADVLLELANSSEVPW